MLDAAVAELVDIGYERVTMLGIARRAGASKETLYSWFGNKDGLLRALIEREANAAAHSLSSALGQPGPVESVLADGALALLRRATADTSVALRRAAVTSAGLGMLALDLERDKVDPIIDGYMAQLTHMGDYLIADIGVTHRLFRGLTTSDLELRVLLGHDVPSEAELVARATTSVSRFLSMVKAS